MSASNLITTRISTLLVREDGILQVDIKLDNEFTLFDYTELVDAAKTFGNGKKYLNLIIVGKNTLADNETRSASCSKEESIYKIADAFVINSLAQILIINFYMKVNKPFVPTKYFNKKEDALNWLKQQE